MSSANFKPKRTAAALHGFLATAQLSCLRHNVDNDDMIHMSLDVVWLWQF